MDAAQIDASLAALRKGVSNPKLGDKTPIACEAKDIRALLAKIDQLTEALEKKAAKPTATK